MLFVLPNELLFKLCHHLNVKELANLHPIIPNVIEAYLQKYKLIKKAMLYNVTLFKKYIFDCSSISKIICSMSHKNVIVSWEVLKLSMRMRLFSDYIEEQGMAKMHRWTYKITSPRLICTHENEAYKLGKVIYRSIKNSPNIKECLYDLEGLFLDRIYKNFGKKYKKNYTLIDYEGAKYNEWTRQNPTLATIQNNIMRKGDKHEKELEFLIMLAIAEGDYEFQDTLNWLIYGETVAGYIIKN